MTLAEQIQKDMTEAMRARDELRLSCLRMVKTALEKNPDLVSARLEVQRADARVHEAWGTALPSLDLSAQYSRAIKKPVFFLPNFFENKPDEIIAAVVAGMDRWNYQIVAEREQAIMRAVGNAHAEDTVLVAGKGHERGQYVGRSVIPFDDREVAGAAIMRHHGLPAPDEGERPWEGED